MNPLQYLSEKYNLDITKRERINILASRHDAFPEFLKDMGVKKMVEIGTYRAQYATELVKQIPNLELFCVDKWQVFSGYKDFSQKDLEIDAYKEAQDRSEKYGFKLIKEWSADASKMFEDGSLDAIFIDDRHDFEWVVEGLKNWVPKVKSGGVVSGHDLFDRRHAGYGVREAIPAYCECYDLYPWFVWKKDKCPSWMFIKH